MPVPNSFRTLHFLFISASCVVLAGCSTLPSASKQTAYEERIRVLEHELRRKQAEIQDLKERNSVLEARLRRGESDPVDSETKEAAPQKETPSRASSLEPTGEQMLYSKILQTYRKRNLGEMEKSLALLLKTYPDSVYADNALYLCGQLAFELGNYKLARQYMDRVLREYPKGNKAVSALYAKAMIEKRLSRLDQAQRLLEQLRDQYPGSPESARVATELKLIERAKTQKRGM